MFSPIRPNGSALSIGPRINILLIAVSALAIAAPAVIVAVAPPVLPRKHIKLPPKRIVPQAELPAVEPVDYADLTPDEARSYNAEVPFSTDANPAARPFVLSGTADDKARAIDCMATAMLYEAGDDTVGQRSVGQVVINRVRHPAFPKTICGVVFQGQERSTGCQFTFTCDGALVRHRWSDLAWKRARETATLALSGSVFRAVGYATHYHTDWVVPYWQSSLDKVTKVGTHLFFRWAGWWGTPPAFRRTVSPSEPVIPALALYSDAHRTGAALADAATVTAQANEITGMAPAEGLEDGSGTYLVTLDPKLSPESFAALATATCGTQDYCKFMAWSSKARTPTAYPVSQQQVASLSFSYLRDRSRGFDKALWNCVEYKRPDPAQCMRVQVVTTPPHDTETFRLETLPGSQVKVPVSAVAKPADGLTGVRRRVEIQAVPPKILPPPLTPTLPPTKPDPTPDKP